MKIQCDKYVVIHSILLFTMSIVNGRKSFNYIFKLQLFILFFHKYDTNHLLCYYYLYMLLHILTKYLNTISLLKGKVCAVEGVIFGSPKRVLKIYFIRNRKNHIACECHSFIGYILTRKVLTALYDIHAYSNDFNKRR